MKNKRRLAGAMALILSLELFALNISIVSRRQYRELAFAYEPLALTRTILTGEITGSFNVAQVVRATRQNLVKIEVFLSNYGQLNRSPIVLTVTHPRTGRLLRVSTALAGTVADNRYHTFSFPVISQSKGRSFIVTLTSPESKPGHAVTAWLNDGNPYPAGSASVNGVRRPHLDLLATLGYKLGSVPVELVNRASQYKPRFFKGRWLKILALLALVVTIVVASAVAVSVLFWSDSSRSPRRRSSLIREG